MILTKENLFFARTDSDLVVDNISINDIVSINEVNTSIGATEDSAKSMSPDFLWTKPKNAQKSSRARKSSVLNISMLENLDSFHEGRDFFAFEIKTCNSGFYRSYFVRVEAAFERDSWIHEVNICLKSTLREHANRDSWLQQRQQDARELYSRPVVRTLIAVAILIDFLSSVFKSEYLPESDEILFHFFDKLDLVLCIIFTVELLLNLFGSWRTFFGSPFLSKSSSWFQIATVVIQLASFGEPTIASFKVARVIRIFHVGSAFKSLASCQMILKAIRQGMKHFRF